jgi:hypothetical protein
MEDFKILAGNSDSLLFANTGIISSQSSALPGKAEALLPHSPSYLTPVIGKMRRQYA